MIICENKMKCYNPLRPRNEISERGWHFFIRLFVLTLNRFYSDVHIMIHRRCRRRIQLILLLLLGLYV